MREAQSLDGRGVAGADRGLDLGGRYGNAELAEIDMVEFQRMIDEAQIAACDDIGDDGGRSAVDIFGHFPLHREQGDESLLEIVSGKVEAQWHQALLSLGSVESPSISSTLWPGSAFV